MSPDPRRRVAAARLIGAALVASALAACQKADTASPGASAKSPAAAVPVVTAPVERRDVPVRLRTFGTVEPSATVAIRARIDGQIVSVHLQDGQEVRKGQLLFELDRRALEARVREAEATLARDRALLANAEGKHRRAAELLRSGFISPDAFQQAGADLAAARATVAADEAALQSARVDLSYTRIFAPTAGRAGKVAVQLGNTVTAGGDPALVTLNTIAPCLVSFSLPERELAAIQAAMARGPLAVAAHPAGADAPASSGRLTFIDNAVDARTGTIRLQAAFANAERGLWPGQYTEVTLTLGEDRGALVIPAEAVQNGARGQYVYVVKGDGTAEMRPVTVVRTDGGHAVVGTGLNDGETVITAGQLRVTPGAKVASRAQ